MELFDSHCHLDFEPLSADIAGAVERAGSVGVVKMINVGTSLRRSAKSVEIAEYYSNVWATVGLHPQDAIEVTDIVQAIEGLKEMAGDKKVVAIGEIGLDYYSAGTGAKGTVSDHDKDKQKEIFVAQLGLAEELKLPVVVHVRDAWDDFFGILEKQRAEYGHYPQGVVHCFTGSPEVAKKISDLGMYVGFTGFVTFEQDKFDEIREAAKIVPLEQILIETDAPFLAPEPYRGKTNEPAFVVEVAKKIAELKNKSFEEVAEATYKNTKKVFQLE
jgi:TatD DNase family protein